MPRPPRVDPDDTTPVAHLLEGALHGVIGYQLAQASIVTSEIYAAVTGEANALRPVEYTVLALVHANPGVTARQLARSLAIKPPNLAFWLDRLESRALLKKQRGEVDARLQHLNVTPAGTALVKSNTDALRATEARALAGSLSAAERAMLVELLHKLARARGRLGGG